MRILHISSARNFGGGEKHFVDLCRKLTERGHDVFVALRPTNQWQEKLDFLPDANVLHVSIRNSFGIFSVQKIADFVRENKIEIIHAHVARDYLPASLVARITKNTHFVLTRHVLFPMKSFHRFALKNVVHAVAVSSAVEANLEKIFPKEKIVNIPNGIELVKLTNEARKTLGEEFRFLHNLPFDAPIVGTVGELKPLKGQRDFVLAAHEIHKNHSETCFVVVGKDNQRNKNFRTELKRLVKIFRLDTQFLFLDWIEDTAPLLAAFDVFVSASHSESFGLAILEAMASGAAVVATETEGAKELIEDNASGKLVPVNQPLKLAEAISELLQDNELRRNLAENAGRTARENFDLERMIEATEKLYERIVESGKWKVESGK